MSYIRKVIVYHNVFDLSGRPEYVAICGIIEIGISKTYIALAARLCRRLQLSGKENFDFNFFSVNR